MTTLPSGHMPGTHWLHPHRHGSTSLQVGGGAMLAIIVEDEDGTLPSQVQNAREVLFIAQYFNIRELESVIRDSGDGVLSFSGNTENEFVTVNGQLDPMIQVDAGEWFRLRVVWANFLEGDLDLRIPGCEMQLLAKDGIYIRDFPREISEAPVPSGGRADIVSTSTVGFCCRLALCEVF
jgi:FtsP/CotA-like multicopper oxidase with cupredoxin domain